MNQNKINLIKGNVTTPAGYSASGVACGLKKNGSKDIALVVSDNVAVVSGVFTKNVVKGHSLQLTRKHIADGKAKAILINSGNANACLGQSGYDDALEMATLVSEKINCKTEDVLVGSTGVIGVKLDMPLIRKGIDTAVNALSYTGGHMAAEAMITTDLITKEIAASFTIEDKTVTIGGQCKGSGMIMPNMATMIALITTDAVIEKDLLDRALKSCVATTFNRVTVDGDMSVCDKVIIIANGFSQNNAIKDNSPYYELFTATLMKVCDELSKMLAKDGEGATKLIHVETNNARSAEDAYQAAIAVANSPLVKTAIYGEDANWGRIITAAGYSGASFDPDKVEIYIGDILTCQNGIAVLFDEESAKNYLKQNEITIQIDFHDGTCCDHVWTCDLTKEYININGSYRS